MPTFQELQDSLMTAEDDEAVLLHLITHIDERFRSVNGQAPNLVIITDSNRQVSMASYDRISDLLTAELLRRRETKERVLGSTLNLVPETSSPAGGQTPFVISPPMGGEDDSAPKKRRANREASNAETA